MPRIQRFGVRSCRGIRVNPDIVKVEAECRLHLTAYPRLQRLARAERLCKILSDGCTFIRAAAGLAMNAFCAFDLFFLAVGSGPSGTLAVHCRRRWADNLVGDAVGFHLVGIAGLANPQLRLDCAGRQQRNDCRVADSLLQLIYSALGRGLRRARMRTRGFFFRALLRPAFWFSLSHPHSLVHHPCGVLVPPPLVFTDLAGATLPAALFCGWATAPLAALPAGVAAAEPDATTCTALENTNELQSALTTVRL